MIKVFIDESGVLGMDGHHFIITALIPKNDAAIKRIQNLVRRTKVKLANSRVGDELKGSLMTTPDKQIFLNKLSKVNDYSIAYIVADKRHIDEKLFAQKNLTFNFLFGLLIKSFINSYRDDIHLYVDNRTVKVTSSNSLAEYIQLESIAKWGFAHDLSMELCDSRGNDLVQAADVISNSIFAHYNRASSVLYDINKYHFISKQKFPFSKFGT